METNFAPTPVEGATNVLMIVAVIAVVASAAVFATNIFGLSSTGYAQTEFGSAEVIIESTASINFTVNALDWGTGGVNTSQGVFAVLQTDTPYLNNWSENTGDPSSVSGGLVIENNGNVDVDLYLRTSNTAANFICPSDATCTSPGYNWKLQSTAGEPGGCSVGMTPLAWTAVSTTDTMVCNQLNQGDPDEVELDIQLIVPQDADPGLKQSTITATAQVSTP